MPRVEEGGAVLFQGTSNDSWKKRRHELPHFPEAELPVSRFLSQKLQGFWPVRGDVFAKAGDEGSDRQDSGSPS